MTLIKAIDLTLAYDGRAAAEEDRSPILPGYESMDSYLEALQPELGRFGATFRELTAEGYLKEEEGEWISRTESRSAFTLRRELYGAERELTYYFVLSPFAGEGDEQALCDIAIHITEEEKQQEWDLTYSDLCGRILEDWDALAAAYVGGFRIASPVDVETVLGTDLCRRAAAEAERRGWTETQEEYLQRLCQEPATALGYNGSYQVWVLNGTGLFLYATRPTE